MFDEEDFADQIGNHQKILVSIESQPVNAELNSDYKLQNDGNAHFDSKINTHERDEELPDRDVHSDFDAERPKIETRTKPRLSKYVRRNYPTEQIIGDKEAKPMNRNKLRSETCLIRKIETKIVNDALQDHD